MLGFLGVLAAGLELVDQHRHGHQRTIEGTGALVGVDTECRPPFIPEDIHGRAFTIAEDAKTGACRGVFEFEAASNLDWIQALLRDRKKAACATPIQHWRVTMPGWCGDDGPALAGGCHDGTCLWLDAPARILYARWSTR